MDIAVIRKIIETSSAEMLSDKARSAAKRKRDRIAAAATPVARPPVPDDMNAEPVLLESYEQSIDSIDSIDGPLVGDDGEEPLSDIEALHEAETEIGIATWLDAETGEPAQGACPPHLDEQ